MIEVKDLTKRYGATTAVDGLSFVVRPGRVTGFLGPNGAGKSTTLRMMLQLDRPSRGEVLIDGRPYRELTEPLRRVGALLDASDVHGGRPAYHHLLALAQSNRIGRERVREVLGIVGLDAVAGKRVRKFSLGMRQRLGIAAALLGDPPVLLLDEPVNGLDPDGVRWIRTLVRSLAAEGRTVLMSSHLMSETALTADHLVVIGRGRLLDDTDMKSFLARHSTASVRVRTDTPGELTAVLERAGLAVEKEDDGVLHVSGGRLDEVGPLAHQNKITVYELTPRTASLEDAFMRLTGQATDHRGGPA